MNQTLLNELVENAVHFGHRSNKWNPKMRPFIYDKRYNIHIFDLTLTAEYLEKAINYVKKITNEGKIILFVSTKPQCEQIIQECAKKCEMPFVTERWISGFLTNFDTIRRRIRELRELKEKEKEGDFEKYTKKEALSLRKTIVKLEAALGGVKDLQKLPNAIFVADAVVDKIAITEAKKLKIPIIAIVDTNANPSDITYPIPGNDDAIKSLKYLIGKISDAVSIKKK